MSTISRETGSNYLQRLRIAQDAIRDNDAFSDMEMREEISSVRDCLYKTIGEQLHSSAYWIDYDLSERLKKILAILSIEGNIAGISTRDAEITELKKQLEEKDTKITKLQEILDDYRERS